MKLKKIASLMLAGIMAVSMLAACGSKTPDPNPGEGEGTQTSGYSAVMADAVSDKVKDMDYVTFQDNAADQAALTKSVNFLSGSSIQEVAKNQRIPELVDVDANVDGKTWTADWVKMAKTLQSELKMHNKNMSDWDMTFEYFADAKYDMVNEDAKCAVLYAVDGNVGTNEAVQTVAELLTELDDLVEEAKAGGTTWHYEYVVSVSVAEKSYIDSTAKFVMVTVDRTVTNMTHA